ncbi:CBM9 family sugar-binding protein [Mesorhizobium onobrychidis]|uniref:Secreted protein n=1 Tax=Mesorhizobium onobrychidis TaxID=2775404 RepID=A0ABY5R8Q7_9HYPH|nr:CBM9 family sugar-binding protein [Mesorhizobium onobrychidis]UVC18627.1 hypothetical protein IHQ72_17070 [Mesorhizobium onobrychidis]
MKIKIICIGVLALSVTTGAALSKRADGTSALDDAATMSPFYTDASMTTLKPEADFTAAWKALKDEDRADMLADCNDDVLKAKHPDFCQMGFQLGGHQ